MMSRGSKGLENKTQAERFKQAARELGCDEDEAHFDERLKKVAQAKPKDDPGAVKQPRQPAKKKPGK